MKSCFFNKCSPNIHDFVFMESDENGRQICLMFCFAIFQVCTNFRWSIVFFSKSHISRQVEDVYNLRGIKDNDIMKARKATKGLPVGWIGWVDFGWTYWFVLVRKEIKTRQQLGRFTWCKKQFRVFQLMLIWRRGRDAGFKLVSWSSRKIAEGYDVVSKAIPDSIRPSYSTLLTYW